MDRGKVILFEESSMKRVGSKDAGIADAHGVFRRMENENAYLIRGYSDQALFCERPCGLILLKGVNL